MNCELARERIVLAAYGELADDAAHELDRHLATCTACGQDADQVRAMKILADTHPVLEPDANLMARSRMRLEEALDALPPKRWFERVLQVLRNNAASLQTAPVAAALLLLVGIGAGSLGGYHLAMSRSANADAQNQQATNPSQPQAIAVPTVADARQVNGSVAVESVSSIVRDPHSQQVEVRYNQLVPRAVRGSLDDPAIRQLLMLASEDTASAGVRDDSVDLLASACKAGHACQAAGIRDALMMALRYDGNAGVRERALEGLQPYVAQDMRVRDAVLEALLNDNDPRIRSAAISTLEPVEADTSVRQALQSVANSDRSPEIRLVSRQVLSRVPEIQ
ncbi:MAG: HEAT repeat domain-containing protein [Acidobacteriota bacterium]